MTQQPVTGHTGTSQPVPATGASKLASVLSPQDYYAMLLFIHRSLTLIWSRPTPPDVGLKTS